ncbi:MAG: hypothetical protein JRN67_09100, partial [Nitrososphaerota archaeon]|nr:hypothetical protein [Nitrososphaerota archaeon]
MSAQTAITKQVDEEEAMKPFVKFDEYDEMQIAEEAKGKVIEEYFYSFEQDGKKVVGISYSGVRHVATEMMKQGFPITIDSCDVVDNGETYRAKAVAKNLTTNVCFPGFAEQAKKFKSGHVNPFAYTIAASKAERNALRKHIPETAIKESYKIWQQSKDKPAEQAKSVGKGTASEQAKKTETQSKSQASKGRKYIKYFETSDKKTVTLPRDHPLYDEFVESCAVLKHNHPEVEYTMRA